jgi:hypothetical protein
MGSFRVVTMNAVINKQSLIARLEITRMTLVPCVSAAATSQPLYVTVRGSLSIVMFTLKIRNNRSCKSGAIQGPQNVRRVGRAVCNTYSLY